MSSIFPKRGREKEMSNATRLEICKLIDDYMASLGATLVHAAKPGTATPGSTGKEWSYLTRFGVYMRVSAHGVWVYMSFGYSNDREFSEYSMARMREVLAGPNSDGRFSWDSGKYNLWFAQNCKPKDALSIFKGDMSLFKRRSIDDMTEDGVKLAAKSAIDYALRNPPPTGYEGKGPARLAARAIQLNIHRRGYDDQSFLEHEEIIRQVMASHLAKAMISESL